MEASYYLYSLLILLGVSLIGLGIGLDVRSHRWNRYKLVAVVTLGTTLYSAGLHLFLIPEKELIQTVILASLGILLAQSPLLLLFKQSHRVIDDFSDENQKLLKQQLDEGAIDIPEGIHDSKWEYELSNSPAVNAAQTIEVGELEISETDCGWCDWSGTNPLVTVSRINEEGFRQFICPDCMMDIKEPSTLFRHILMVAVTVIGGGGANSHIRYEFTILVFWWLMAWNNTSSTVH